MKKNKIIYQLVINDIQNVAEQEIDRKLTEKEIEEIKESIAEKIKWYEAVADSIHENIQTV